MSNSVAERIKQVMAVTFNVPESDIQDDASQQDIAAWDSIGHANLLLSLEDELGATLSDDVMPTLTSVPKLVEYFSQPGVVTT
jgi:acyl carrier protein